MKARALTVAAIVAGMVTVGAPHASAATPYHLTASCNGHTLIVRSHGHHPAAGTRVGVSADPAATLWVRPRINHTWTFATHAPWHTATVLLAVTDGHGVVLDIGQQLPVTCP